MKNILFQQYEYTKRSRESLFVYCASIADTCCTAESATFGRGSIRNLLVHSVNAYAYWIGEHALKKKMVYTAYESVQELEGAKELFAAVDNLVSEFFGMLQKDSLPEIEIGLNGRKSFVSPCSCLRTLSHMNFTTKGKYLSLSRHLGYIPVDTDIIS